MVEDMNKAMPRNIADAERRARFVAEESARCAGTRLDDWFDEPIADEPDHDADDRLSAVSGRLARISGRSQSAQEGRAASARELLRSTIERLETRIGRSEEHAARAFESVADILERTSTARDGDRRALLEALRKLEARNGVVPARGEDRPAASAARTNAWRKSLGELDDPESLRREPTSDSNPSKSRLDLKAALSQIAMRSQEVNGRGGNDARRTANRFRSDRPRS